MKQVLKGHAVPKEVGTHKSYSGIIALVVILLLLLPLFANNDYNDGKKQHKSGHNYNKHYREICKIKRHNKLFNTNGCRACKNN